MSAETPDDVATAHEQQNLGKGRSRSLRNMLKSMMKISGDQPRSEGSGSGSKPVSDDSNWIASKSNLSNEAICRTMEMVKDKTCTLEEAWKRAMEMELEERFMKESSLNTTGMTQLSPSLDGKSPERPRSNKAKLISTSSKQSPITPSDTDSAQGTEGATGSEESSPHSIHNYSIPPDEGDIFDPLIAHDPAILVSTQKKIGEPDVGRLLMKDEWKDEDGLMYRNGHADRSCQSEDEEAALFMSKVQMGLARTDSVEQSRQSVPVQGDMKEPPGRMGAPQRNRSASSPAGASATKQGKSFSQMLRGFGTKKMNSPLTASPLTASITSPQSPDGGDRFSETSDNSPDPESTISSFSSASSKSSGDVESKSIRLVDPSQLNSRGEYIGPYTNIAVVTQDFHPSPYASDGLPLKTGEIVYITVKQGGYWEGVCGQRRGKFKFINVRILSPEEDNKRKDTMQSKDCDDEASVDTLGSEFMPKLSSLKELLERIECEQYFSVFQLHDFATLDQFKYLEADHLESLEIVDQEHRVKILTAAQILRDPKSGKDRAASQHLHRLLWPARNPKGRMTSRDSGFYASTDTCASVETTSLLRRSEVGDSLIEECETSYPDDDNSCGMMSHNALQENSNVNNSNCVQSLPMQNERHDNWSCRHGGQTLTGNRNGHPLPPPGSPHCTHREGSASANLLAQHSCRMHANSGARYCTDQATVRDSPLFKHRHLAATFSDPGSADSSPRPHLRPAPQKPPHQQSLDMFAHASSEDRAHWRRSALMEMYCTVQDQVRLRSGSGSFVQGSISKTHPSPKLSRHILGHHRYHSEGVNSPGPKGRRKARSASPHKRQPHPHHHELGVMSNSVHASPTLPLRATKPQQQQASAQLEWLMERLLQREGIDLKEEPYSNKMGFCGIPPALVQRYAEELEAEISDIAVCVESIRVRNLVDACRCWFRSDTLANQSAKLVYAGTGSHVVDWLVSIGLPMYVDAFTLSGWDELDIVIHMEEDDLRKCGIDKAGHLRRLTTALEHLKMSWKPV